MRQTSHASQNFGSESFYLRLGGKSLAGGDPRVRAFRPRECCFALHFEAEKENILDVKKLARSVLK